MDRPTRAQQRAAAIDVSPTRLAAEIERLTRERDIARRQTELARAEIARLMAEDGAPAGAAGSAPAGAANGNPAGRLVGRVVNSAANAAAKAALEGATRERDEYLAALQRERAEFLNFKRRTSEEREAMYGLAAEGLIRSEERRVGKECRL